MKRFTVKILLLLLVLALCLPLLAGCSGKKGKTLIEMEGVKVSVNTYELLLSRMKGALARSEGLAIENDDFWTVVVDSDNTTYEEYLREAILENAKTYAVGVYLFDEVYGLTLPKETVDAIDQELKEFVEYDGDGSKTAFNAQLSQYGVNYQMLRDAYIMEAKVAYLQDHLYGTDGTLLSDVVREEYYQAARIDGTSRGRMFRRITLPMISPMLFYLVITGFIGAFKAYSDAVAIFGTNLNAAEMNTIVGYIYDMLYGNSGGYPSYASAAAIILFLLIFAVA